MNSDYDIAIVGMSCRFPGARNLDEFWRNLAGGVESIARLSDREILACGVPASYLSDPSYVKAAPALEQPGAFDAAFFGFSPMEARTMDPQHRILLELAHEALEDAGCDPQGCAGRIGVFTGAAMNTYLTASRLHRRLAEDYIPTLIVNDKDFLSTRISYKLNLKGPSITVQTACSTSLVAVHLARQSLLSGETDVALAGAISVRVPHRAGYFADAGGVSSPDGRIRAFDAKANGTVFGSGGGVVVLKRLADAVKDGDTIHAVIKGSAVNNDGSEKAGYTAPGVNSQADCVVEALANAGIEADSVSCIEAHGSGTPVGDPIEVAALTKAFRASTARSGFCAIGSVKTNIGHLDAAAGIAGLIKTVLALEHRQIPATLNFSEPNPEIDFPATPFYVNSALAPWTGAGPRRAGVMSTGMGGTNAHVVLEEAPPRAPAADSGAFNLLVLSARTPAALDSASERLRAFLEADASAGLDDVAFTLQAGRRSFSHRRYLVCADRADAIAGLAASSKRAVTSHSGPSRRPLVLLLPGVGDHYVGMAHDLYCHFDVFRSEVDRCARILEPQLGSDIRKLLYPDSGGWKNRDRRPGIDLRKMFAGQGAGAEDADSILLNQAAHAQPALFAVEYALAKLWMDLGVVPDAIIGHSMGEYVAACLAGVLSLEDALRLIVRRTQLVDRLPRGRMLAVALAEEELLPLLDPGLSICLINGPKLCVVAGIPAAVDELERILSAKGVLCRSVQNTHAFHSRMLDPIVGAFEAEVRKVRLNEPRIPYVSNVTGTWVTKAQATDPACWASHTNHTARFDDALRALWQLGDDPILLEAGPGRTIGVLAMQHPARKSTGRPVVLSSMRHHYENRHDVEFLLQAAGGLWACGADIRWDHLHQGKPRRKVSLPTYPFERQEYWFKQEDAAASDERPAASAEPELSGIGGWFYAPAWERVPDPAALGRKPSEEKASWLVFTDRWGGGAGFRRLLEKRGAGVVHVARFGSGFRRAQDGSYELDPAQAGDYLKLFREIQGTLAGRLNIVHLGCLTRDEEADYATRSRNQDFGFFSLLYIAQAIGQCGISAPIRIGVVSNRVHEVTGEEALDPDMATVLGAAKVVAHEFPNVACFNIDLPAARAAEDPASEVMARIVSEFDEQDPGEVIAYRGKHRWQRKYRRVDLPAPASVKRLRERGVYLITGGTGGLGLAFAKYLAKTCRARLVLTKKTPFPDKSRWPELLEIERLGAEVEVVVADASDPIEMRRAVERTLARFQAINGVFHAAGIVAPRLIKTMTKEAAESVLAPKVQGTRVLFDLLKDAGLDFMVLFSSMSSVTGPYAHADYSAANCFLDAFADYSNSVARFRTLAINWPVWKETGIGAGTSYFAQLQALLGVEGLQEEMLKRAILTDDALEAFARALASDLPQIVVSPENLGSLIERSRLAPAPSTIQQQMPRDGAADLPASDVEAQVAKIWRGVFGHEHIGLHEHFADLGGHSLIAMQIVARVRSVYRIDLSLRDFLAVPTIARLSADIEGRILREIDSLSDDEAGRLVQAMSASGVS